jgi:hypothetical protein
VTVPDDDDRIIYQLSDEHFEWTDLEDLAPELPTIPAALRPFFLAGAAEVGDLFIYAHGSSAPRFAQGDEAVEATPQEVAEWRSTWAKVVHSQRVFRKRLKDARVAYEAAAQEALAELAEATKPWAPVEDVLKTRSAELAANLHAHRTAAEEWKEQRDAKEQEHLDAIDGPRVIALYKPKSLNSHRQADHIARVHLVTCQRRTAKGPGAVASLAAGWDNDEGLRANDAWRRLADPGGWVFNGHGGDGKDMQVKFCSSCKPWTVFQEHIEDFPRPRYTRTRAVMLGEIQLTDYPESWQQQDKES